MQEHTAESSTSDRRGRREFIKTGALLGIGAALGGGTVTGCRGTGRRIGTAPALPFATPPMERVRMGFVGVGGMGSAHVRNFLKIDGVDIKAVCDIVPEKVKRIQQWVTDAGQPKPAGYSRGDHDFLRMCETEDLDLVFTATPWRWHVPVCVAAMKNGKHAATEVPAAYTVEDCWMLVEHAERLEKHCVMMENCCYGRSELMVLNMVRRGLLGELLHGEAGYLHDLRELKFADHGEGLWRRAHAIERNGNLYPTHGLGPIAQCMNVNRGDRFDYLVSMSSNSRGLELYAREHFPEGDPKRDERFALGDVNVSLIRTALGKTIYLAHNCDNPRPYSRINMLQGTRGLFRGYPDRIHIEGRSPDHRWEEASEYRDEFDHPLWRALNDAAHGAGHGGMDFIEDYRLIQCLREGAPLDMDVYDAAAWSVVCELTERSVANRSRSIDFPDFTRGRWKTRPALGIVSASDLRRGA